MVARVCNLFASMTCAKTSLEAVLTSREDHRHVVTQCIPVCLLKRVSVPPEMTREYLVGRDMTRAIDHKEDEDTG